MESLGKPSLHDRLGCAPDLDLFGRLYVPSERHTALPDVEDEHGVTRIEIRGVVVRFVQDDDSVYMTVEGTLSETVCESVAVELKDKLSELECTPYRMVRLA